MTMYTVAEQFSSQKIGGRMIITAYYALFRVGETDSVMESTSKKFLEDMAVVLNRLYAEPEPPPEPVFNTSVATATGGLSTGIIA